MAKSIETIWREGFLQGDVLSTPKINDLYNQKSQGLVDQLQRMFKINLLAILAFAVVVLIASLLVGVPYLGAALFVLFGFLVVVGKRAFDRLDGLDKSANSYEYLKSFDAWLKDMLAAYTRIYRVFYPAFFLTLLLGLWFSELGSELRDKLLAHFPDIYLVAGVPVYWGLGALLIAGLLGLFAGAIYRLDMHLVYGAKFKKLEELIADMEELRG